MNMAVEYVADAFFNEGRRKAFYALKKTLNELQGRTGITELHFRDVWFDNLQRTGEVIAEGWYNPPPKGMSVLTGGIECPSRVSFGSLRDEKSWPGDRVINWNSDLMYAYGSPVHVPTGRIGDLGVTLYFGDDPRLKKHRQVTHQAIMEVMETLPQQRTSRALFQTSQAIFEKHRLRNCVISHTDVVLLDLGHTFPSLSGLGGKNLTERQKNDISKARQFINAKNEWAFDEGLQFTIEPQLVSLDDPALPQMTYHYLVLKKDGKYHVCRDVDRLMKT